MNSHPELPMPLRIRLQVCSIVNMDLQLISAALTLPISLPELSSERLFSKWCGMLPAAVLYHCFDFEQVRMRVEQC